MDHLKYNETEEDREREAYIRSVIEAAEPETTKTYWMYFSPSKLKPRISDDMSISFLAAVLDKYGIRHKIVKNARWSLISERKWLSTLDGIICVVSEGILIPLMWDASDTLLLWQLEESGDIVSYVDDRNSLGFGLYNTLHDPYPEEKRF